VTVAGGIELEIVWPGAFEILNVEQFLDVNYVCVYVCVYVYIGVHI